MQTSIIKLNKLIADAVDNSSELKPVKKIKQKCDEVGAIPFDDFKKEFMRQLDWYYKDKKICSSFPDFDKAIDGYEPGKLIVIATPPAVGKTELIISLMTGLAVDNSVPVGLFSLEMPNVMVVQRIVMNVFEMTRENMKDVVDFCSTETREKLNDAPIHLNDSLNIDIKTLIEQINKLSTRNIRIIFIDNLQLIKDYEKNEENILNEIKHVTEESKVTIIASFGIKRKFLRNNPISIPYICKRINNILQFADIVAMLDSPGYYSQTIAKILPDLTVMYFLKNTYSLTYSLDFKNDSRICKFTELRYE